MAKLKLTEETKEVAAPKPPPAEEVFVGKLYSITMQEVGPDKYNLTVKLGDGDAELISEAQPFNVTRGQMGGLCHKLAVACTERK